jgi:hypothetical protein
LIGDDTQASGHKSIATNRAEQHGDLEALGQAESGLSGQKMCFLIPNWLKCAAVRRLTFRFIKEEHSTKTKSRAIILNRNRTCIVSKMNLFDSEN